VRIFAGIDGGGTRTRLALADEDGAVLSYAEAGCCCYLDRGLEQARMELEQLWQAAWRKRREPLRPADALFMGMGSILSTTEAQTNCELAVSLHFVRAANVRADNDAHSALVGGLLGQPGILLISGTGSACFGRNEQGQSWRAGGWGYRLNDIGSAYGLGLSAMVAVTRAADGRGQLTQLTAAVVNHLGIKEVTEMYRRVHEQQLDRAEIAKLAPTVIAAADAGDVVAREILKVHVQGLIEMVVVVANRLRLSQPLLALTGGLISSAPLFHKMFLQDLNKASPGYRLVQDGLPPVLGSVMLAAEAATGTKAPISFVENLRRTSALYPQLAG
jgi:N-acetylglucosamine kinase-like BadF-type ATPase